MDVTGTLKDAWIIIYNLFHIITTRNKIIEITTYQKTFKKYARHTMRHNKRVEFIKNQLLIWFLGSRWEFIFLWILDNIIKLSVKSCCATARNFVYFILISHIFTKYCQGLFIIFYIYLEKCSKFILTWNFFHSHLKSQKFWNKVVSILNYNWVDVFMFIILNTQKKNIQ